MIFSLSSDYFACCCALYLQTPRFGRERLRNGNMTTGRCHIPVYTGPSWMLGGPTGAGTLLPLPPAPQPPLGVTPCFRSPSRISQAQECYPAAGEHAECYPAARRSTACAELYKGQLVCLATDGLRRMACGVQPGCRPVGPLPGMRMDQGARREAGRAPARSLAGPRGARGARGSVVAATASTLRMNMNSGYHDGSTRYPTNCQVASMHVAPHRLLEQSRAVGNETDGSASSCHPTEWFVLV